MNLINENRYEVTKQLFEKHNIDMPESDTKIYANVFEVIAYFVNNKLTDEEMFLAYDFLSDFLLNKKVEYNVFVSKEDRIRAQVRVMEEIPETAGKLTMKEKIGFAFCMYSAVCLQKYDEPSGTMKNIIELMKDKKYNVTSLRVGTIRGEHEVIFYGDDEYIRIKHTALSRKIFANGALESAKWLLIKEKGLFSYEDYIFNK